MKYWLFRIGIVVIPHLPEQLVQRVALAIGWLIWACVPARRQVVYENLRHVPRLATNPPALRRAVRDVFGNSILNYVDFFRLPAVTGPELDTYWNVVGRENLDAELAKGHGCVVIAAHMGNFDYAMRQFIRMGYTLTVTQEHLKPERLHQFTMQIRTYPGVTWAQVDSPSALRQLFTALRRNQVVIMPADRDIQGHGELVSLFGAPVRLPIGSVQLVQRTGAGLLGVFPHRRGLTHGFGEILPLPELTAEEEASAPDELHRNLHRVAKMLEVQIEQDPEQWVVFEPIWEPETAVLPVNQQEGAAAQTHQPEEHAPQPDEHLQTHHVS